MYFFYFNFSVCAGLLDSSDVTYKHCSIMRAELPRSLLLHENPGKRIKIGVGKVEHDRAIGDAILAGDEGKTLNLARRVAAAKCEFRSSIPSSESLGRYGGGSELQNEEDYLLGSTFGGTQSSLKSRVENSDDEYEGSGEAFDEEADKYSDGSDHNSTTQQSPTSSEMKWQYEVYEERDQSLNDSELSRELRAFEVGYFAYLSLHFYVLFILGWLSALSSSCSKETQTQLL